MGVFVDKLAYRDLPEYTECEVSEEIREMFTEARTNVVLGSSIYAYAMARCEYIFTESFPRAVAATHGDRNIVFINPNFFRNDLKNAKQRAFVVIHEIDHIFFMHQARCIEQGYDHGTFNEAADYFINLSMSGVYKDEFGRRRESARYKKYFELPSMGLYDEQYLGLNVDQIYEKLVEKNEPPEGGFDVILGDGGSAQKKAENLQTLQAAVVFAEQNNQIGDCEGRLVSTIRAMAEPVVQWTDYLTAAIRCIEKTRPTYTRLSRRCAVDDGDYVVFPSYTSEKVRVLFGFDTSGSMQHSDYLKIAGELYGILSQFENWELILVTCDVTMRDVGSYSSEEGDDFTCVSLKYTGGGGTDMSPIASHAQHLYDIDCPVDACIIVTDGEIPYSVDDCFCPLTTNIVLSTRNKNLRLKNAEVIYV